MRKYTIKHKDRSLSGHWKQVQSLFLKFS